MTPYRSLTMALLAAGMLFAAASQAQPAFPLQEGELYAAPGLKLIHATRGWIPVQNLIRPDEPDSPWDHFQTVLGVGWLINRDAAFGTPRWILGPGYDVGRAPLSPAEAVAYSRRLALELAEALGIDDPAGLALMRTAVTVNPYGHQLLGVAFKQTYRGYDVRTLTEHRRVIFRWDLTLGRLSNLGSDWIPGLVVDVRNPMPPSAAVVRAHQLVPAYAPGTGRVLGVETYVLVGLRDEDRVFGRLVHEVRIQTDAPPHLWAVIVDALNGDLLYLADELRHADVIGNVSAGSLDGPGGTPPAVPFSVKPLRDLYVSVVGGNRATTDAQGNFRIPHSGTSPVTITGRFAGLWCTVNNRAGANTSFSTTATPGVAKNVVMNGTHQNEFVTAEATAYHWTTLTHYFVRKRWATYRGLPGLPTNVNISNSCNAYWNGTSINFFRSSSSCNNTAFAEVVSHEYGHGFHTVFHGSTRPGWFSEGIGDHLGLYVTGQRILGRGFFKNGRPVRDYRPGGSACCTQWPPQGKEVHKGGEIWAGFCMDLRDNLIQKMGQTQGINHAEKITIAQYARNPSDIDVAVRETFVEDDDDGNLLNGTPNFAEIAKAADAHSIPRPPDPQIVQITHTPLPTSRDVVNPYVVKAKIISLQGTITGAVLTYNVNGGANVQVPMTAGPNDTYTAQIPAQPAVSVVNYKITATDSKNNTASLPMSGMFSFTVGHEIIAFQDDFETDKGWKPDPGDNATTGRFERADPIRADTLGRLAQPEDDHTPGPGRFCYVTQNGSGGFNQASLHDVDNGKTSIVSPTFSLQGLPVGSAKVDFAYWLTMYTTVDDQLRLDVSSNGGSSWLNIWSVGTTASLWRTQTGVTLPGPYTNNMKLRFWVSDSPNNSVTDALVDDVVVRAVDDNVAALRANTRKPPIGATLNFTLQAPREPNALYLHAMAFTLGPVPLPGIGVMDLGLPVFPLTAGFTNGSGNAAWTIGVPNDPVIKGLTVYTQCFIQGGAKIFSNVWQLTIQ